MTANNICKTGVFRDTVFLKAHCHCGSDDCAQTLIVEADRIMDSVTLEICSTAYSEYTSNGWWSTQLVKLKWIFSILVKGRVEVENCFIFRDTDAVDDYITALQEAREFLKVNT